MKTPAVLLVPTQISAKRKGSGNQPQKVTAKRSRGSRPANISSAAQALESSTFAEASSTMPPKEPTVEEYSDDEDLEAPPSVSARMLNEELFEQEHGPTLSSVTQPISDQGDDDADNADTQTTQSTPSRQDERTDEETLGDQNTPQTADGIVLSL